MLQTLDLVVGGVNGGPISPPLSSMHCLGTDVVRGILKYGVSRISSAGCQLPSLTG